MVAPVFPSWPAPWESPPPPSAGTWTASRAKAGVVRTYGGAALSEGLAQRGGDDPLDGIRRAIARAAAALVEDGSTIVIGSGTTALAFDARSRADA